MFPRNLETAAEKSEWFRNKVLRPTYQNQDEHGHREKFVHGMFKCPYPVMLYNASTGVYKREDRELCSIGKGAWCSHCWRWNRHKNQTGKSKSSYLVEKKNSLRSYLTTGLAYSVRKKPNPVLITDPYRLLR